MFIDNYISSNNSRGFTLLEILIALFIFSILSVMMMSGLRTVINADAAVQSHADRLHQLQITLLLLSRDISQAIDRPTTDALGQQESSFIGTEHSLTLTHLGASSALDNVTSNMQRVHYGLKDHAVIRETWPALDKSPQSKSYSRQLLQPSDDLRFQYLGADNNFSDNWVTGTSTEPLPRAVRVFLSIPHWGTLSQLYVVSAQ